MSEKITVYYDGLCRVCAAEIGFYRRAQGSESIRFVDIFSPDFDVQSESLDAAAIHKELHVRKSDGSVVIGVDAFVAIWEVLPRYRFIVKLAKLYPVGAVLRLGYRLFVQIRPFLPRRAANCGGSPVCKNRSDASQKNQ